MFSKAVEVLDHPSYFSCEVALAAGCSSTDEADSISRRESNNFVRKEKKTLSIGQLEVSLGR